MKTLKLANNLAASPSIQMDSAFAAGARLYTIKNIEVATKNNSCLKSWPVGCNFKIQKVALIDFVL